MAQYEVMVLYEAPAAADGHPHKDEFEKILKKLSGKITQAEDWGERSLAYPLKGRDRGYYAVYEVEIIPHKVKKLETQIYLQKGVLRHLVVKKN